MGTGYQNTGGNSGNGTVDQTIIDGSTNPVSGNAVHDALANVSSPALAPNQRFALKFDRTKNHNVYAGQFWIPGTVYNDLWFDCLCIPQAGAEYLHSAGYGGWHNLLIGFNGGDGTTIGVTGNVASESGNPPFGNIGSGTDRVMLGDIVHVALGITGGSATVYLQGVPCARLLKSDGRRSNGGSFETTAYVGGSDHSNFNGYIFWQRIFENLCLRNSTGTIGIAPDVFLPEINPMASYAYGSDSKKASFALDFSVPNQFVIPDLSETGFEGRKHSGILNIGLGNDGYGNTNFSNPGNAPQWELKTLTPKPTYLTPAAVPVGALIYDSFSRQDKTYLFSTLGGLGWGATEGGSLGVKTWQDSSNCGILNGRGFVNIAVGSGNQPKINTGLSNIKFVVKYEGSELRGSNVSMAYDPVTDTSIQGYLESGGIYYVYKRINGNSTQIGNYNLGSTSNPFEVALEQTPNGHIKLWIDGVVRMNYDNSANPALTGTYVMVNPFNSFNRVAEVTVYNAVN